AEEEPRLRARLGRHGEQVLAAVAHRAAGCRVRRVAGKQLRERALARAVRPHDRVHLPRAHGEVHALQYLAIADAGVEIAYLEQDRSVLPNHPTLPSSFSPRSLV